MAKLSADDCSCCVAEVMDGETGKLRRCRLKHRPGSEWCQIHAKGNFPRYAGASKLTPIKIQTKAPRECREQVTRYREKEREAMAEARAATANLEKCERALQQRETETAALRKELARVSEAFDIREDLIKQQRGALDSHRSVHSQMAETIDAQKTQYEKLNRECNRLFEQTQERAAALKTENQVLEAKRIGETTALQRQIDDLLNERELLRSQLGAQELKCRREMNDKKEEWWAEKKELKREIERYASMAERYSKEADVVRQLYREKE